MKNFILFLCVCLFCLSGLASDLSFVAGAAPTSDLELSLEKVDLDNFSMFGLRFEKDFFYFLGFENSLLFAQGILSPSSGEGSNGLYYTSNLVVNLGSSDVLVPNLTVGLGFMNRFGDSFPDPGLTFLTNWGGGLKLRRLFGLGGLRIDYRRYKFHDIENSSVNAHEISGGLMFSF